MSGVQPALPPGLWALQGPAGDLGLAALSCEAQSSLQSQSLGIWHLLVKPEPREAGKLSEMHTHTVGVCRAVPSRASTASTVAAIQKKSGMQKRRQKNKKSSSE